jgi:hypothetical protein
VYISNFIPQPKAKIQGTGQIGGATKHQKVKKIVPVFKI